MSYRAMLKSFLFCLCFAALAVPFSAPATAAPQAAASVRGTVADPDDAVIPGATITFQPPSGKAYTATSQPDGGYVLGAFPPVPTLSR